MIILSDTEETEVEHLNELGLHSEALDAVERELQIRENTAILWEAEFIQVFDFGFFSIG